MYSIYGLFDPRTGELRYVGKTVSSLKKRLREHLSYQKTKGHTHRENWIKSLLSLNLRPDIQLIQAFNTEADMDAAEVYWIKFFRDEGCDLVNKTDGGEGSTGYRHSAEIRAKMSALKKGKTTKRKGTSQPIEVKLKVSRTKSGLTYEQQLAIVELYKQGVDSRTVAEKFGVSQTVPLSLIKIFNIPLNRKNKLTLAQEQEVIKIYTDKTNFKTLVEIGQMFNVSETSIRNLLIRNNIPRRLNAT